MSSSWSDRDYTAAGLYSELTESSGGTSNRLDQNLSYLKKYLNDVLGQSTDGPLPLANPRDWFVGAYAYVQLALENPLQFRRVNVSNRFDLITARGRELTNFLRSLTFRSGTNVNWDLHAALLNHYSARLDGFLSQVQATEQQYADQHLDHFPLNTWRNWAANAPRLTAITTSLQAAVPGTPPGSSFPGGAVAVSAGYSHSLALKIDGTVVGWGADPAGKANGALAGSNVVAIESRVHHSLALKADGTVVGWGSNASGQRDPPAGLNNVMAIAAGYHHSLALKADGTVVAWGCNAFDQTNLSAGLSNVVAVAAGGRHNVFLAAQPASNGAGGQEFVVADVPTLVATHWLREVNADLLSELNRAGTLRDKAIELSGARALLQAVLELGLPYTLQRDEVLHGAFYGTEMLADLEVARSLFAAETNKLSTTPEARPLMMGEIVWPRYDSFAGRLDQRLASLEATGQVGIPRIVGRTLRLLNLLRDAWATTPPPALETGREGNAVGVILHGEPYTHYTLQYRDNLSVLGWATTGITNMHNESFVLLPSTASQRFYRSMPIVP